MTKRGSSRRLEPNAIISEVARPLGLRPQQVFAWRREARKQVASVQQDSPAFVPAVVAAPEPVARHPSKQRKRQATRDRASGARQEVPDEPRRVATPSAAGGNDHRH
ncbi:MULTISPECIES: transposase [unclassified Mesorhizobium]|uniref:transposase n=1 Tax=unclassified Mesorhizobium TaxID=325217 RepID=UPI0019279519